MLTAALLASAGVGYAIVRITSPTNGDNEVPTITSDEGVPSRPPSNSHSASNGEASTTLSTLTSTPTETIPDSPSPTVPPTQTADLAGSDVVLPAGWTGTATVTLSVLGDCAPDEASVYRDLPADIALDLVGNEAHAAELPLDASISATEVTLTLGLNPNAVPSLAVYTSQLDDDGELHHYWDLDLSPGPNWTEIHGTLVQLPGGGMNPNMMVDAESAQLTCGGADTVSLPRVLTAGSTLDGWVTRTRAKLTLRAVTADGKRQVEAEIDAQRRQ